VHKIWCVLSKVAMCSPQLNVNVFLFLTPFFPDFDNI
jgi:hypothetical protein